MSEEFNVGDVVVCIDAKPHFLDQRAYLLSEGTHYRIGATGVVDGTYYVAFKNFLGTKPNHGWAFQGRRFRKIESPKTEIADRIRACRPAKSKQPA